RPCEPGRADDRHARRTAASGAAVAANGAAAKSNCEERAGRRLCPCERTEHPAARFGREREPCCDGDRWRSPVSTPVADRREREFNRSEAVIWRPSVRTRPP